MPSATDASLSLIQSFAAESAAELLGAVGDLALDAAIDSGALDGVPVVGLLTGGLRAGRDIRDALFVRKVALFLQSFVGASRQGRTALVDMMGTDEDKARVGSTLLILLERAESMKKPVILGRILKACALGYFDLAKALRLCALVDRCYAEDLELLKTLDPNKAPRGDDVAIAHALQGAGFIVQWVFDGGDVGASDEDEGGGQFMLNEYGELLLKHAL